MTKSKLTIDLYHSTADEPYYDIGPAAAIETFMKDHGAWPVMEGALAANQASAFFQLIPGVLVNADGTIEPNYGYQSSSPQGLAEREIWHAIADAVQRAAKDLVLTATAN